MVVRTCSEWPVLWHPEDGMEYDADWDGAKRQHEDGVKGLEGVVAVEAIVEPGHTTRHDEADYTTIVESKRNE